MLENNQLSGAKVFFNWLSNKNRLDKKDAPDAQINKSESK